MSVLSISRKPRDAWRLRALNPVMLGTATGELDCNTTSSTLRKTYPKIPADCYRNGATANVTRMVVNTLRWSLGPYLESVGLCFALRVRPPFTVVICWIPVGAYRRLAATRTPLDAFQVKYQVGVSYGNR